MNPRSTRQLRKAPVSRAHPTADAVTPAQVFLAPGCCACRRVLRATDVSVSTRPSRLLRNTTFRADRVWHTARHTASSVLDTSSCVQNTHFISQIDFAVPLVFDQWRTHIYFISASKHDSVRRYRDDQAGGYGGR